MLSKQRCAGFACDPTVAEGSSAFLVNGRGGEREQQLFEISISVSPFYARIAG